MDLHAWLTPHMKGMHSMTDGWCYDRNSGSWKVRGKNLQAMLEERFQILELCWDDNVENTGGDRGKEASSDLGKRDLEEPPRVLPVEPLLSNVKVALVKLTAPSTPPRVKLRARGVLQAPYLSGDASGSGFESVIIKKVRIIYESGTWTSEWAEESSNFREADNLVTKIEALVREGKVQGQEVFLFIDNSTFEFMYYRGYTTSWKFSAITWCTLDNT